MKDIAAALASITLAAGAIYMLYLSVSGPEEEAKGKTGEPKRKSKRKKLPAASTPVHQLTSLKALSARCDAILASARPPAERVVLLEQVQLAVDAIGGTPKRKQRRKRLNLKIEAAIARLEAAAASSGKKSLASSFASSSFGGAASRDDVVFETARMQKGYKTTADGRTTSFFHREIDDEAKRLIGNISPKRISNSNQNGLAAAQLVNTDKQTQKKKKKKEGMTGSAWNANGQTWEDKTIFPNVWKNILADLYNAPLRTGSDNAGLAYSLEQTLTCGDVIMKWKNKTPAFIFDITVKLRIMNADGNTILRCTVYHVSGDDCSVEFKSVGTKIDNAPALKNLIRQDVVQRTARFELRLKKQHLSDK